MIGRLIRRLTHARRLAAAKWDLSYNKSALEFYTVEVARSQRTVDRIESERIEIFFPKPAGLKRGRA